MLDASRLFRRPACAGGRPALAQKQVNVYNWSDYIAEDQLKVFNQQTGIKVNYTTYDSNEILDAKLKAGRSGYDVVVPTASPFLVRQLAAKLYQPLDKAKLKNLGNLDPEIMAQLAKYDPGNAHAMPWMWGTTGLGYNVAEIRSACPTRRSTRWPCCSIRRSSSRFNDCGVMMLDSPTDVFPAALKYLGLDPDSKKPEDLDKAADGDQGDPAVDPQVPFVGVHQRAGRRRHLPRLRLFRRHPPGARRAAARPSRARSAMPSPRRGDAVDRRRRDPQGRAQPRAAHRFLDFMMEPEVAAASSTADGYANANSRPTALLDKSIPENPLIYPPADSRARLYTDLRRQRRADARAHAAVDRDQDRPLD